MAKVKWGLLALLTIAFGLTLHYSLPQNDIVRIVGTDVKRMDIGGKGWFWAEQDALTDKQFNRDVRFINAVSPDGDPYVYRNEDTNWSYPPYFKFDSGSLVAAAQGLVSTEGAPVWGVVTHYGWRIEFLTMFPNVVDIRPAESVDETIIPWFNIFSFIALAGFFIFLWRLYIKIMRDFIDPLRVEIEIAFEDLTEGPLKKVKAFIKGLRSLFAQRRANRSS